MDIYANVVSLISALFGLALLLAGGWLWPWGITDLAWSAISTALLLKAAATTVLAVLGTRRIVDALA